MAYTFKCKDLGMECPFAVTAETKEEVVKHAGVHGGDTHQDMMANMSDEQKADLMTKVESLITES